MSDRTNSGRVERLPAPRRVTKRSTDLRIKTLCAAAESAHADATASELSNLGIAPAIVPKITNFSTIASNYEVLLVDLFGTLWDGKSAFPLSLTCMREARASGIRVIFLSNTPRPNINVTPALHAAGIDESCYDMILTSGEAARRMISSNCEKNPEKKQKIYHIGPDKNLCVLAGLDVEQVTVPEDADFVLNTGPPTEYLVGTPMPAVDSLLQSCFDANLPMVCVNPDVEVKRESQLWYCAGELGKRYTALGGKVSNYGKPYVEVFEAALQGLDVEKSKVLMIGDGAGTDMVGAKNFGCDGLWIIGTGIHAEFVGEDEGKIGALAREWGIGPVGWMQEVMW